jgi:hypothetical protein
VQYESTELDQGTFAVGNDDLCVQASKNGITANVAAAIFATSQSNEYIYPSSLLGAARQDEIYRAWNAYYAHTTRGMGSAYAADIGVIYQQMAHSCDVTFVRCAVARFGHSCNNVHACRCTFFGVEFEFDCCRGAVPVIKDAYGDCHSLGLLCVFQ